jgi:hypothetical protein
MTLDDAFDELYGVTPKEFVPTRKRLAGELRSGGDADGAKQLASARRPTTAAWSVNRLARDHPDLVEDLVELSAELRTVQARGTGDDLRAASTARRAALSAATDAAVALAGVIATNPEAHRDTIAATLEAASVDDTLGAALRAGRLVREAVGPVGFPEIAPLALVDQPKRSARRSAPAEPEAAGRETSKTAEYAAAVEQAEAAARRARQLASERAVAAGEAEERLDQRGAELEAAQDALRDAKADVRRAHAELKEAERAATLADRAVEKARERLV